MPVEVLINQVELGSLAFTPRISVRQPYPFPKKNFSGDGYLAGEFPGGTTTIDGVPSEAEVRVLWRDPNKTDSDGCVVASVMSGADGTWRVSNLNTAYKYDVVGRKAGFNDVIASRITPTSMVEITYSGAVVENETFTGAVGFLELVGGIPPYSVAAETPFPSGLFPVINGRNLIIDGTTDADEVASFDVKVTSSNGAEKIIPLQLVVGFKAPANFKAKTVVVDDVFSVLLTWEATNSTQQIRVYRSVTPFDMNDLPEPIATLSGTSTTYTDDDVIGDDKLFYLAVAFSEGFSKPSNQIYEWVIEGDPHWSNVTSLLHFDGSLVDKAGASWNAPPVTYSDGLFGQSGRIAPGYSLLTTNSFGSQDFTVEVAYKGSLAGTSAQYPEIFSFGNGWGAGFVGVYTNCNDTGNKLSAYVYGKPTIIADVDVNDGVFHRIALVRNNNSLLLFCDGVLMGVTDISGVTVSSFTRVFGVGQNSIDCLLDEFRITEGVPRYSGTYTPNDSPFLDK